VLCLFLGYPRYVVATGCSGPFLHAVCLALGAAVLAVAGVRVPCEQFVVELCFLSLVPLGWAMVMVRVLSLLPSRTCMSIPTSHAPLVPSRNQNAHRKLDVRPLNAPAPTQQSPDHLLPLRMKDLYSLR
jgi:hypothetical protein